MATDHNMQHVQEGNCWDNAVVERFLNSLTQRRL
jgi:hypothetical protein